MLAARVRQRLSATAYSPSPCHLEWRRTWRSQWLAALTRRDENERAALARMLRRAGARYAVVLPDSVRKVRFGKQSLHRGVDDPGLYSGQILRVGRGTPTLFEQLAGAEHGHP